MRHPALARAVAGHQSAADEGEHRRGIDDAALRFREKRSGRSAQAHRAGQIDVEDFREHGRVMLGAPVDDPGAINQYVELRKRRDKRPDRGAVAHVERCRPLDREGRAPLGVGRLGLGCASDGDVRTELG